MNVDKVKLRVRWNEYRRENGAGSIQFWREMTVDSEEARWYIREIDTMLVEKARHYIHRKEMKMLEDLRVEDSR